MVGINAHHFLGIHYISGGNGLAAIYVQNNGRDSLLYAYTDNQGSLVTLTDQNSTVIERYAYDPWGARRNPDDWTQKDNRSKFITNRGYTMHEHLDAFGIINMNGRVYDPATAMFYSPDPLVQAPENWLNYNRYSYCLNNPLIYTDPSGYGNYAVNENYRSDYGQALDPSFYVAPSIANGDYLSSLRHGGGGGGIPTPLGHSGFSSWNEFWNAANDLYDHQYGGYSNGSKTYYFKSNEQALFAGFVSLQRFGGNNYRTVADASNSNHDINLLAGKLKTDVYENGTLTIKYGEFKNDLNCLGIQINVTYIGDNFMSNADWKQTITTNSLGAGGSNLITDIYGLYYYNDDSQGGNGSYYSASEMKNHIAGCSVNFVDAPRRDFGVYPITWRAELTLYNNGAPVIRVNYGFDINYSGCKPTPYTYYIYP
jgi:RHS repeat-associated protein